MALIQVLSDRKAREKPCIRCGYSLRGNLDATHCPECGMSVWLSLNQNDSLEWSNPPWLAGLAVGAWIMAGAQLLGLVGWGLILIPEELFPNIAPIAYALMAIYFIVYHAAVLAFLCRHEHRHPDRLKSHRLGNQIVAGIAIFIGGILLLRAMAGPFITFTPPPPPTTTGPAAPPMMLPMFESGIWFFLSELTLGASVLATWLFLRRLRHRVPSSTVAKICSWMLLAPLIPLAKVLPFFAFCMVAQFGFLLEFAPLIYFPGTAILLGWFALTFKRCSNTAAEHWAKETTAGTP